MESKEAIMRKRNDKDAKPTFAILKQQDIRSRPAYLESLEERAERWPCAYTDGHRQCPLPGTMTSSLSPNQDTKWYCWYHFQNLDDPATCQRILDEFERLPLPRNPDWRAEALAKWTEEHAEDPVVKRAWLLAEGKGSREDKHDLLQDLIRMAKGIATPLPYDPLERGEQITKASQTVSSSSLYWEAYKEGFNKYGLRGNELVRWAREQAAARGGKPKLLESPIKALVQLEDQKSD
jgi:hypothetical protein